MKQYFVPYDIAKELKEIGFDEICLAWYYPDKNHTLTDLGKGFAKAKDFGNYTKDSAILAPLYDQVIDWLESNHQLFLYTDRMPRARNKMEYYYSIKSGNGFDTEPIFSGTFDDRKSALNRGIKKAIELIKQKK